MRSLVDVRLRVGNRGVKTRVRVSAYDGRDTEGVDKQVGRGGWGGGWGVHWHCATAGSCMKVVSQHEESGRRTTREQRCQD